MYVCMYIMIPDPPLTAEKLGAIFIDRWAISRKCQPQCENAFFTIYALHVYIFGFLDNKGS